MCRIPVTLVNQSRDICTISEKDICALYWIGGVADVIGTVATLFGYNNKYGYRLVIDSIICIG